MGNKNYLFGRNKTNRAIDESNRQVAEATAEINKNTPVKTSAPIVANLRSSQSRNTYSGNLSISAIGRSGLKILSKKELLKIYNSKSNIDKYKNGGILVPEGSLHKNRHHIEESNPELAEELTKKGIPIVVTDNNGEISQVAEIEESELIFEKSLTDKIEELRKDGSDEAALKCGKLVMEAFNNNCTDNTGLVDKVD